MDIGVYTSPETLYCKKNHGMKPDCCYWTVRRKSKAKIDDKIWFAVNGKWAGYFRIMDIENNEIYFYSDTWHTEDGGARKPFRGFTYNVPKNTHDSEEQK